MKKVKFRTKINRFRTKNDKFRARINRKQLMKHTLQWFAVVMVLVGIGVVSLNISKLLRRYNTQSKVLSQASSNQEAFINQSSTSEMKGVEAEIIESGIAKDEITESEVTDLETTTQESTKIKYPWLTGFLGLRELEEEPVLYEKRPDVGDEIGELYIPKLDAILPIFEGTSEDELELGVGHYSGSVLPGEKDNSVLSGHRDTVFRRLGEVRVGDSLIVRTIAGEFEYQVDKVRIVEKDDRTVIVPRPRATLTLSTCYPFSYLGSAPKRYILVAYLVQ